LRPTLYVVNESVRIAGRQLANSLLGAIEGKPAKSLQSLTVPTEVETL
jgi:LacI family transcriptional regulator